MEMLFSENNTKFELDACSWEDAINQTVEMLESNGLAGKEYKKNIISDVKKYGSYIMISPGIVIPHTRPERGAIKSGFALATVSNDVYFSDNLSSPIKILVAFTATDDDDHIKMLTKIFKVIQDGLLENIDYFLDLADNKKINYLNKFFNVEV